MQILGSFLFGKCKCKCKFKCKCKCKFECKCKCKCKPECKRKLQIANCKLQTANSKMQIARPGSVMGKFDLGIGGSDREIANSSPAIG